MAKASLFSFYSTLDFEKIDSVQFGLLDAREIQALSVVEVTHDKIYDSGIPADNGVNDLRMGTMDKAFKCATCQGDYKECPGHFGHIELSQPVFHIGYIDLIKKILSCVCFNCHRLLMSKKHERYAAIEK